MRPELKKIKEVGKNKIADFVRSETGSIGVKNAATIAAFAGALALSPSSSEALSWDGTVWIGVATATVVIIAI